MLTRNITVNCGSIIYPLMSGNVWNRIAINAIKVKMISFER
jgi:hypothetical protein